MNQPSPGARRSRANIRTARGGSGRCSRSRRSTSSSNAAASLRSRSRGYSCASQITQRKPCEEMALERPSCSTVVTSWAAISTCVVQVGCSVPGLGAHRQRLEPRGPGGWPLWHGRVVSATATGTCRFPDSPATLEAVRGDRAVAAFAAGGDHHHRSIADDVEGQRLPPVAPAVSDRFVDHATRKGAQALRLDHLIVHAGTPGRSLDRGSRFGRIKHVGPPVPYIDFFHFAAPGGRSCTRRGSCGLW